MTGPRLSSKVGQRAAEHSMKAFLLRELERSLWDAHRRAELAGMTDLAETLHQRFRAVAKKRRRLMAPRARQAIARWPQGTLYASNGSLSA